MAGRQGCLWAVLLDDDEKDNDNASPDIDKVLMLRPAGRRGCLWALILDGDDNANNDALHDIDKVLLWRVDEAVYETWHCMIMLMIQ